MHVTDQFVADAIDAHVDDHGAGANHLAANHFRNANRCDQAIGSAADLGQVFGATVGERHGGIGDLRTAAAIALGKHHRHRLAHDIAAADDDHVLAGDREITAVQKLDNSVRACKGRNRGRPCINSPTLTGEKASTSFSGATASRTARSSNPMPPLPSAGSGSWTRIPWTLGSSLRPADDIEQFLLAGRGRQAKGATFDPDLLAGPAFVANIHLAGGVFSNEDRGQSRASGRPLGRTDELLRQLPRGYRRRCVFRPRFAVIGLLLFLVPKTIAIVAFASDRYSCLKHRVCGVPIDGRLGLQRPEWMDTEPRIFRISPIGGDFGIQRIRFAAIAGLELKRTGEMREASDLINN